ncbi:MAG TPA: hypothetical protein VII55_01565 [Candidatus Saccharimonadales bacterium]
MSDNVSAPGQPESPRPQAYVDFLLRTQDWESGGQRFKIPVSGYGSNKLALAYGFPDLQAFADDLPNGAEVLDVGAGVSPLGIDVCRLRPDIHWVSADTFYYNTGVRDKLQSDSPPNLTILPANALTLTASSGEGRYNRVLSSYLFIQLWKGGAEPVQVAAAEMLKAAAPDGMVSALPVDSGFRVPGQEDRYRIAGQSIIVNAPPKLGNEVLESQALLIARATKLSRTAIRTMAGPISGSGSPGFR